ncbi:MAG: Fic family protein [Deltaproteobacteria bacterium]|nr:Fic family protein [Deltaproteobacteria bacterium]
MRKTGYYEALGDTSYFIPYSLPPKDPKIDISGELALLYGESMHRLGLLSEMAERLPDLNRFIKAYVIKEALLSSAIEGIHTTIQEVYTQSLEPNKAKKETQLVLNYTVSLELALKLIEEESLPIVSRVILSSHEALMRLGEGDQASPGQYRKQAVRVGEHVPPPASQVIELMSELEKFINTDQSLPPLIQAGLAHVQFEIIHPFLDGNGRIGRLLIVLMLIKHRLLLAPIIYPSYFFKKNHAEYYQRLDAVRTKGDFEGWIVFYLEAIRESAHDAYQRVKDIEKLEKDIRKKIKSSPSFQRTQESAFQALNYLFQKPIMSISDLASHLGKSYNTSHHLISSFIELGFLEEISEQKRHKLFRFSLYLNLLEKDYLNNL